MPDLSDNQIDLVLKHLNKRKMAYPENKKYATVVLGHTSSSQNYSICLKLFEILKNKIQYFGDHSSLHGVGYVCSLKPIPFFKRLFWLTILILCSLGAAAVLRGCLGLYSDDVISYSVETNYIEWVTPFPAVTVCEQLDPDRVKSFLSKNNLPTTLNPFFKEVMYWSVKYCNRVCSSCKYNTTCLEDFQHFAVMLRLNCSQLLTDCWWNGKHFPCCERFHPLPTEYGVCFSFNSQLAKNESVITVSRRTGLPNLLLTTPYPVMIRIHAPDEAISVTMDNILGRANSLLPLTTDFEVSFKAEETISDESISALAVGLRGCLYRHERPAHAHLWPFADYTYNTCLLYHRALKQLELCNCTHYFMPKLKDVLVCDVSGMACLNENKDSLVSVDCDCPMACEEILYKVVHIFNERHSDKAMQKRGTRAKFSFAQLPTLRVRRQTIRGMLGLVVDIGGVGGVFFGASVLSVLEILYLFCIRRRR